MAYRPPTGNTRMVCRPSRGIYWQGQGRRRRSTACRRNRRESCRPFGLRIATPCRIPFVPRRRSPPAIVQAALLMLAIGALIPSLAGGRDSEYPTVQPGVALVFPRDHGAHPGYRTEWWYITGWVQDQRGNELGVQVTFFRNRPLLQEDNPSAFAPRQLLFAHAAIADPRRRTAAARPARGARGVRDGLCQGAEHGRAHRRLVAAPGRRPLSGADQLARAHPRPRLRGTRTAPAGGPQRVQPQGAAARPGQLLLQPAATRSYRGLFGPAAMRSR